MLTANGLWRIDLEAPHTIYKNAAGKRLPGVTTVRDIFDKPQLKRWGLGMERDGILALVDEWMLGDRDPADDIRNHLPPPNDKGEPTYFCEQFTERAADVGTIAHAMAEAFLHGTTLEVDGLDPDMVAKASFGFENFHRWWCEHELDVLHSELVMVSESMQIGGTADIIARSRINGALVLIDLKTTKPNRYWPYDTVLMQVAAYARMYTEVSTNDVDAIEVVRIGKEAGDPGQVHHVSDRERLLGMRMFVAAKDAYEARKELGRG